MLYGFASWLGFALDFGEVLRFKVAYSSPSSLDAYYCWCGCKMKLWNWWVLKNEGFHRTWSQLVLKVILLLNHEHLVHGIIKARGVWSDVFLYLPEGLVRLCLFLLGSQVVRQLLFHLSIGNLAWFSKSTIDRQRDTVCWWFHPLANMMRWAWDGSLELHEWMLHSSTHDP